MTDREVRRDARIKSTGFSTASWKTWAPVMLWSTIRGMRGFGLLCVVGCFALRAQDGSSEKLAPYYPTPETVVEKMLQLGGLKAGEKMFDLGSGDGRIVIVAAQKFHAEAVGVELDKNLSKKSS